MPSSTRLRTWEGEVQARQMEWMAACRRLGTSSKFFDDLTIRKETVLIQSSIGTNDLEMSGDSERRNIRPWNTIERVSDERL
jgi:hypothetical protein